MRVHLTDADAIEAAARLTDRQRQAVFLVCVRRLTLRDAGQAMGVSHVRVQAILRQARAALAYQILEAMPLERRASVFTGEEAG
jgi:DNA-directed RNA polymerase specialized sigma24 family protein